MLKGLQDEFEPFRSLCKLPKSLCVKCNQSNTGYGIWTKEEISSGMRYGPYEGVTIASPLKVENSSYCWQIKTENNEVAFLDAADEMQSNWLRYVNCASVKEKQNMMILHYDGLIYYQSFKTIPANTELLVWYGNSSNEEFTAWMKDYINIENPIKRPSSLQILNEIQNRQNIGSVDERKNDCNSIQYKCSVCNKKFKTSHALNNHQRFHSEKRPFACDICSYKFETNQVLQMHKTIHINQVLFRCSECQNQYSRKSSLQRHKRVHTGERPYICDVCQKRFMWQYNLQKHKVVHMKTKDKLHHKKFTRDEKLRSFMKKKSSRHNTSHTNDREESKKKYECETCHKKFKHLTYMKIHKTIHTGEEPYKCNMCHKPFIDRSNCNAHKRTHTKERHFKCDLCDKRFVWSADLYKHKRVHTGEKPYECNTCHKKFSQFVTLNTHKRLHTGEKPFECDVCLQKFTDSSNMRAHKKRKHVNKCKGTFVDKENKKKKHHKSDVDNKKIFCETNLQKRRLTHIRKKYECDICHKKFIRLARLNSHRRLHTM